MKEQLDVFFKIEDDFLTKIGIVDRYEGHTLFYNVEEPGM